MKLSGKAVVLWVLRAALGVFFIWIGVSKVMDLDQFTDNVSNYQFDFLERPRDAWVAYFMPWLEIFTGMALLSWGVFARGGLILVMGMMILFVGAISWAWSQGLNISCGCFGASDEPMNYPWKIAQNAGLFFLSMILLCFEMMGKEKAIFASGKYR